MPEPMVSEFDMVLIAVRRAIGRLLARGNTSDVYEWTRDAVVKLLRPKIPPSWALIEANTTTEVRRAGLPVPAVYDIVTVEGRRGLVMERIPGETLSSRMASHPGEHDPCLKMLADLQQLVGEFCGLVGLPTLKDRLRANIAEGGALSSRDRDRLQAVLEDLPDGRFLCHFDFHPGNVIMGSGGPVVIDWFDASMGDPAADLARTAMLLRNGAAERHEPDNQAVFERIHRQYVANTASGSAIDLESLLAWEMVVLGARLAEPISQRLLSVTKRDLAEALAGESPVLKSLRACQVAA